MIRDLICVHRARDIGSADIVVAWLDEQGIAAMVKDRLLTGHVPQATSPRGIEVCVIDPAQAGVAKTLLREHDAATKPDTSGPPIDVICEDCGRSSVFPKSQAETVQSCPHCRAYLDVPGPFDVGVS